MKNGNVSAGGTLEDMSKMPVTEPPTTQGDSWQIKVQKAVEARRAMKEARRGRPLVASNRRELSPEE